MPDRKKVIEAGLVSFCSTLIGSANGLLFPHLILIASAIGALVGGMVGYILAHLFLHSSFRLPTFYLRPSSLNLRNLSASILLILWILCGIYFSITLTIYDTQQNGLTPLGIIFCILQYSFTFFTVSGRLLFANIKCKLIILCGLIAGFVFWYLGTADPTFSCLLLLMATGGILGLLISMPLDEWWV